MIHSYSEILFSLVHPGVYGEVLSHFDKLIFLTLVSHTFSNECRESPI
jgi:hypothetical protein